MDIFGDPINSKGINRCILIPGLSQHDFDEGDDVKPAYIRYMTSSFATQNKTFDLEELSAAKVTDATSKNTFPKTNKCSIKRHTSNKFGSNVQLSLETNKVKRKFSTDLDLQCNSFSNMKEAVVIEDQLRKRRILKANLKETAVLFSVVSIDKNTSNISH